MAAIKSDQIDCYQNYHNLTAYIVNLSTEIGSSERVTIISAGRNIMAKNVGGVHIGNIGGDFAPSGDIVGRDKVTKSITNGFQQEESKTQFARDIEDLRDILDKIRTEIQKATEVSQDDKDNLITEIKQQVDALKTAKEESDTLLIAQQPLPEKSNRIMSCLQNAGTLLDNINKVSERAVELGKTLKPYIERGLPLLLSARHLFGLP